MFRPPHLQYLDCVLPCVLSSDIVDHDDAISQELLNPGWGKYLWDLLCLGDEERGRTNLFKEPEQPLHVEPVGLFLSLER